MNPKTPADFSAYFNQLIVLDSNSWHLKKDNFRIELSPDLKFIQLFYDQISGEVYCNPFYGARTKDLKGADDLFKEIAGDFFSLVRDKVPGKIIDRPRVKKTKGEGIPQSEWKR